MSEIGNAMKVILSQVLKDLERVNDEVTGFDAWIAAEAVGAFGLVSHMLSLHMGKEGATTQEEYDEILGMLRAIFEKTKTAHLILHDSQKAEQYHELLENIIALHDMSLVEKFQA